MVTLTAGQTIALVNDGNDIDTATSVGGPGGSLTAWILIEKMS